MESAVGVNIEFLTNYLFKNDLSKEKKFSLLKMFDEKSLINLSLAKVNFLEEEDFEFLCSLIDEVIENNKDSLKKEFNFSDEELEEILHVYSDLIEANNDTQKIFETIEALSKMQVTALLYIANYKGDENLFKRIFEINSYVNLQLTKTFVHAVEVFESYSEKNYEDNMYADGLNEDELFEDSENIFSFGNKSKKFLYLTESYNLTECLIVLKGLNKLYVNNGIKYVKILTDIVNYHITNENTYYSSTVELSIYAKRFNIKKLNPKSKIVESVKKIK